MRCKLSAWALSAIHRHTILVPSPQYFLLPSIFLALPLSSSVYSHAHCIEESPSGRNYANCLAFRVREERQVRLRNEQAQMNWKFPEALDPHLAKRCAPLPLELAVARKAIVLSVCCGMAEDEGPEPPA